MYTPFFCECKNAGTKTCINAFERFVIAITGSLTSSADSWCCRKTMMMIFRKRSRIITKTRQRRRSTESDWSSQSAAATKKPWIVNSVQKCCTINIPLGNPQRGVYIIQIASDAFFYGQSSLHASAFQSNDYQGIWIWICHELISLVIHWMSQYKNRRELRQG